jgi:carbonic anhydrase/acetyltransferase-like protein (isoleucine patch superfamily)
VKSLLIQHKQKKRVCSTTNRSSLIRDFGGKSPRIPSSVFVAPSATLIGEIILDEDASIWFGAVLRAESGAIRIGRNSNVQDNCIVHTDQGFPVSIGEGISVGHGAVIHGATIGSNCLVGMRSTLLNGSSIGKNSLVAAGSLVTQGTTMPPGMLIVGSPAVAKRKLNPSEIEGIRKNAESYDRFRQEYLKMDFSQDQRL